MASSNLTLEGLKNSVNSWTLADDAKVLECMKTLSDNLLESGDKVKSELSTLDDCSHNSFLAINNANISFMALANSQFVENRVYDEDVTKIVHGKPENGKSDLRTTSEKLLNNVRTGMQRGVDLLDTHFDKVVIDPKQFDDDDAQFCPPPIYQPKSMETFSSLPFLIGSMAFHSSESGGIIDDDELTSDSHEDSPTIINFTPSQPSLPHINQNSHASISVPQPATSDSSAINRSVSSASEHGDTLFHTNNKITSNKANEPTKVRVLPVPIMRKQSSSEDDWGDKNTPPRNVILPVSQTSSILPPSTSQVVDSFSEDEDDDLFSVPKSVRNAVPVKPKELGMPKPKSVATPTALPIAKPTPSLSKPVSSLFSDGESDENDIFTVVKPKSKQTTIQSKPRESINKPVESTKSDKYKAPQKTNSLFDDDSDENLFGPPPLPEMLSKPVIKPQNIGNSIENKGDTIQSPKILPRDHKPEIEDRQNEIVTHKTPLINEDLPSEIEESGGDNPSIKVANPFLDELKNKLTEKGDSADESKTIEGPLKSEVESPPKSSEKSDQSPIIPSSPPRNQVLQHVVKSRARIPAASRRPPSNLRGLMHQNRDSIHTTNTSEHHVCVENPLGDPIKNSLDIVNDAHEKTIVEENVKETPNRLIEAGKLPPLNSEAKAKVAVVANDHTIIPKSIAKPSASLANNLVPAKTTNLFDSDSDDNDIFSSAIVKKPVNNSKPVLKQISVEVAPPVKTQQPVKSSIFDDSSDDDLFK